MRTLVIGVLGIVAVSLACGASEPPPEPPRPPPGPPAATASSGTSAPAVDRSKELEKLAADAYVWGYPAVFIERQKRAMTTNVGLPLGTFAHGSKLPTAESGEVFANLDALLSSAWLELADEAWLLKLPDMGSRWFSIQMFDAYGEPLAAFGSKAAGGKAQTLAITGPEFKGTVPAGAKELKSPTKTVWILARTRVTSDADVAKAGGLLKKWSLLPQSGKASEAMPPAPIGRPQDIKFTGPELFDELGAILKDEPPPADVKWNPDFEKAGIGPGLTPSKTLKQEELASIAQGIKDGEEKIEQALEKLATRKNGWDLDATFGQRGADPLRQAAYVLRGLDWPVASEGLVAIARVDDGDRVLSGAHEYDVHFDKAMAPPADAFWTMTLYSTKSGALVPNAKKRYELVDGTLKKGADGAIDVVVSADPPKDQTNWLPAPKGEAFMLTLRIYQPSSAAASWEPPVVKRTK
ncbi:MAG TPA: DUF1214 domain-containing protein [Polyangiaceae bacterium]|nr:DUF1214 domain-containing protein [Polyangiaceae bacterium]